MFQVKQNAAQANTSRAGKFKNIVAGVAVGFSAMMAGACGTTTKRVDPNKDNPVASGANLNTYDRAQLIAGAMKDLEEKNVFGRIRAKMGIDADKPLNITVVAQDNNTGTIFNPGIFTGGLGDKILQASTGTDYQPPKEVKEGEPAPDIAKRAKDLEAAFNVVVIDRTSSTMAQIKAERDAKSSGAVDGSVNAGLLAADVVIGGQVDSMEFTGNDATNRGFFVRLKAVNLTTGQVYWTYARETAFESTQSMLSR